MGWRNAYSIKFSLTDGEMHLNLSSTESDKLETSKEVGFLFENDSSLLFKCHSHQTSQLIANSLIYFNFFELTKDQLLLFANRKVVKVFFYGDNTKQDVDYSRALAIESVAICFFENIDFSKDLINTTKKTDRNKDLKITVKNSDGNLTNCEYTKNEVDEIEGWRRKTLKDCTIARIKADVSDPSKDLNPSTIRGFHVNIRSVDTTVFLTVYTNSYVSYCVNDKSILAIKFTDGEVLKINNQGKTDCGKSAEFTTSLSKEEIKLLKSKEIIFIRLSSTEGYFDFPNIVEPKYFINHLDCVTN